MPSPTDILENPFRRLLSGARIPLGTWLMSGSPAIAEAMGRAAFDWLLIDLEHVPLDDRDVLGMLQAIAGTDACPIARLAANEPVLFKRALDMGAQTVMVPFVNDAQAARRAVSYAKYPPEGIRGYAAMHRASGYGSARDYARRANGSTCVIIQLETPQAVAALEEIAAVPGVDALFLGPGDLSASMGHIGNIAHPEVQAVIQDVARRCRAAGIPCGIVGPNPEMVSQFMAQGYSFVAIASDLAMMIRQAGALIQAVRGPDA
ncbi:2-dehydro-3-deoxyglucarate aldolase [Candidimonas humi]|uniref:HpcH/HpaI aldolase/citrate lyase family protein n=1 Tax=Candidimonas humi TaxID=683355 RepID=A0ABV8P196_9BURK|nr:aldolase/citrate lyase family protein [Candidimonas humi]MBV6305747.1 2-dehydro-3-deoxyglucarate aldolase [Candidimonas humi]